MSHSFRDEVLGQLQDMGSDISRPHSFDFYLYVPTEVAAKQAAAKVRESDFSAEVIPPAERRDWLCRATIKIIPEAAPLDQIGSFFDQIAAALHGDFDGWESDVIKRS